LNASKRELTSSNKHGLTSPPRNSWTNKSWTTGFKLTKSFTHGPLSQKEGLGSENVADFDTVNEWGL